MRPIHPLVRAHAVALIAALAAGALASWSPPLGLAIGAGCLAGSAFRLRKGKGALPPVDALAAGILALLTAGILPALALARDPYHAFGPRAALPTAAAAVALASAWMLALVLSSPAAPTSARTPPTPSPGLVRAVRAALIAYAVLLPISIAGMQISLGILAIVLGLALVFGARSELRTTLDAPIALLAVACGLSIACAQTPTPPWQTTASFAVLSFFVVSRALAIAGRDDPSWRVNLCMFWAMSSAATCALAVIQHWTGFDLVAWLGLRAPVLVAAPNDPGHFAGLGTFASRLALAHVTLLPISMLLGLILLGALPRRRWILAAALGLELAGLWSTLARAAWLSLAAVLALAGGLALVGRRTRRALPALLAIAAAALLVLALSPGARERAAKLSLDENRDRLFLWARGAEVALAHPFLGVGFGSYPRVLGPFYDRYEPSFPMRTWTHNQALSLLCETGPLGLLAYLWVFTATVAAALRALRQRTASALSRALSLGGALAATTFFAVGLFHDPLYQREVAYNLFFALSLAVAGTAIN